MTVKQNTLITNYHHACWQFVKPKHVALDTNTEVLYLTVILHSYSVNLIRIPVFYLMYLAFWCGNQFLFWNSLQFIYISRSQKLNGNFWVNCQHDISVCCNFVWTARVKRFASQYSLTQIIKYRGRAIIRFVPNLFKDGFSVVLGASVAQSV